MRLSLVQMSPTNCDASLCVIKKSQEREGHGPGGAAAPQGGNITLLYYLPFTSLIEAFIVLNNTVFFPYLARCHY